MGGTDDDILQQQIDYYRQRAGEYDQWHARLGRYDRGDEHRERWLGELATVRGELKKGAPLGRTLEFACGTGLWTPLLASLSSSLTAIDASPETIAINREKNNDPNTEYVVADIFNWQPGARYDVVFFGFWLSHVPPGRLDRFWELVDASLAPGGRVFFVDSLPTESSRAIGHIPPDQSGLSHRKLNDGSEYTIVKVFHEPVELQTRLAGLGWRAEVVTTGEFFLFGTAQRA